MPFREEIEFLRQNWVERAEEIINRVQERWLYRVELYRRYDQMGRVTHAEWGTSLFPTNRIAKTFAALQEADYYLQVEPPENPEAVFRDFRTIRLYPALTFGQWARRFPLTGKGSLVNRKADGVPTDWQVLGWFYDLLGEETLPRLIVRQISSVPRYAGTYYLVRFEREAVGNRREIALLERELKFGKCNPYLDHLVNTEAETRTISSQPQVLTDELMRQMQNELWSLVRSRRTLFELHRQEARQRKLATFRLPRSQPRTSSS